MGDAESGQVNDEAARVYEEFFVPALFGEAAHRTVASSGLAPGKRVLDVACGTGILARTAARWIEPGGAVVGVDRNPGMLAVARRIAPEIDWREGRAEDLDLGDDVFDAVFCQFGVMFFDDPVAALAEMRRVAAPGAAVNVAVWGSLDVTPGYRAMVGLLDRLFGSEAAGALRAPFALGGGQRAVALMDEAGFDHVERRDLDVTARFPSLEAWVRTDVRGWTLADMIDEEEYETLQREASRELAGFVGADGRVEFASPALLFTARA